MQSHRTTGSNIDRPVPYRPTGDSAITIEFGDEIDEQINVRVVAFANTFAAQGWSGIRKSWRQIVLHAFPTIHASTSRLRGHGKVKEVAV